MMTVKSPVSTVMARVGLSTGGAGKSVARPAIPYGIMYGGTSGKHDIGEDRNPESRKYQGDWSYPEAAGKA
jgi:hypothetical protein